MVDYLDSEHPKQYTPERADFDAEYLKVVKRWCRATDEKEQERLRVRIDELINLLICYDLATEDDKLRTAFANQIREILDKKYE